MAQLQIGQQDSPTKNVCFRCHKPGHWARDCPENATNRSPISPSSAAPATTDAEFPLNQCRCGAGLCEIRVSGSRNNPGRKYYRCPGKYEKYCGYFMWCDKLRKEEILDCQPKGFPTCGCGAGICTVKVEDKGPNAGRSYFGCPIKKGDGACNFHEWLDNSPSAAKINPEDKIAEGDCMPDGFDLTHEEAMQIDALQMGACELPLEEVQVHIEDGEGEEISDGADETSAGSPEVQPHPVMNIALENILNSKLAVQSGPILPGMIQSTVTAVVTTLSNSVSKDMLLKYLTACLLQEPGWPSRTLPPSARKVIISAVSSFFTDSFPSFDPVTLPEDNASEDSSKEGFSSSPDDQPWDGLLLHPSGHLQDGLNEGSIMTGTILQAFEKLAHCFRSELIALLESMGPQDHETMAKEADCTFAALDRLQVNYELFHLRVTEYIKQAAALAHIERSISNDSSSRELIKRYHNEKSRFKEISRAYCEARNAFMASNKRLSLLRENASCLGDLLAEMEIELSCCEMENIAHRDSLLRITKTMSECNDNLQAASLEALEALKQSERREIELSAAKAAFEKARAQLRK